MCAVDARFDYTVRQDLEVEVCLDTVIDGDTAMAQNGLGLVAADAIQCLHDKLKQALLLAGLETVPCRCARGTLWLWLRDIVSSVLCCLVTLVSETVSDYADLWIVISRRCDASG